MLWRLNKRGEHNYILDYYSNIEYIGKDSYGHHNLAAQTKNNSPLGIAELEGDLGTYQCTPRNKVNLQMPICELNAMSIEGTVSTEVYDKEVFDRRFRSMKRIIEYKIDKPKSILENITLVQELISENVTFIYIKATEITKRKIYWTIWAKDRNKYSSYKEFKNTWDATTGFWSRLEKSVKNDIRREIKDLLVNEDVKKHIKKSVKKELEKALKKDNPFKRF